MNNSDNSPAETMQPAIRHSRGISMIWLIPLMTLMIGIWLVVKTVNEQGPVITINFKTADGVVAGKTKVKHKSVDIGLVEEVNFAEDLKNVRLSVQMDKQAEPFLKRGSNFWVVRPRLSLRGASGLGTLVSGAYIELEPGEGAAQSHFVGLEEPPVVKADEAGKEIVLQAEQLGSVDIGSPVYYRGIQAGEVQGYEMGNDRRSVFIHVFVKAPFDELVKGNSRFWNVSGIDVSLDSEGFNMRTDSFQSMLLGGIAFDTPESIENVIENIEELVFTLYDSRQAIEETSFTRKVNFVLFFQGSVRGLNIGAPVEFKGIKVGRVVDIRLEFDPDNNEFRIPVLVEIEPERVIARGDPSSPQQLLNDLVERGLRARLQTGSLLTGKLFVELDMHPDTRVRMVSGQDKIPELPTIPAELDQITNSVMGILAKLNKLKIEEIGDELLGAVQGVNTLVNDENIPKMITQTQESLQLFKQLLITLDVDNVNDTLSAGRQTLQQLQNSLALLDNLLRSDSPMQFRIIRMADEMAEAARSLQGFLELLEQDPQSLIFGKGNE